MDEQGGSPEGFLGEALRRALMRSRLLSSPPRPRSLRARVAGVVASERRPALILEYKRCRPTGFTVYRTPWGYVEALGGAADAWSVLVEPYWFCGSPELVSFFAQVTGAPVLAKDFTASVEALRLHAGSGASATLLILDMLGWRRLVELYEEARGLGLEALIETSSAGDAVEAMHSFPDALVGINARDLVTLREDTGRLLEELGRAAARKPTGALLVAESTIDSVEKARAAAEAGADALLIGTWAMRAPGEVSELPRLLRGTHRG